MTDIATREPDAVIAGDTWQWRRTLSDYPAPTWTLTYYLRGINAEASFAATADGMDHLVTVAKATTAAIAPGAYDLLGVVTDGTSRYTLYAERLVVQPDPASIGAGHDARSHARKTLEALEAVIENKATRDQLEYAIGGRSLKRMSPDELLNFRDRYRAEVYAEKVAADRRKGGSGGMLQVRL